MQPVITLSKVHKKHTFSTSLRANNNQSSPELVISSTTKLFYKLLLRSDKYRVAHHRD